MKFQSIDQALFELCNIAKGGALSRNSQTEFVEIKPRAKMTSSQIKSTVIRSQIPHNVEFGAAVINEIKRQCNPLQQAFLDFFWGYDDLFGYDGSLEHLAGELSGSFELNRCFIMYYRDKCRRKNWYRALADILDRSERTAKDMLNDKRGNKRVILDGLYRNFTNLDNELANYIDFILTQNGLLKNIDIYG